MKIKLLIVSLIIPFYTMAKPLEVRIWQNGAPNSNDINTPEIVESIRISNISDPSIYVYLPANTKKITSAIIICPGGGYSWLSMVREGSEVAEWLNGLGITAIVLKYRLPNGHHDVPLSDAQEALRIVRKHAAEWNINPNKVGVLGFSAGGHLASTVSTQFTDKEVRPDFTILFYPVITMDSSFTHQGSRNNLIGKNPNSDMVKKYSSELNVTPQTPSCYITLSDDDKSVPSRNSVELYKALKKNGVPATMYIFPHGGHGGGLRTNFEYHKQWVDLLEMWLKDNKIIEN
ncbi:MAG: alpha/beta hydrolase [Prevotellaceae bacterium]|jgi:acetyl esterase/lipase|nr:alpha/beta hydrolase [Prevotellaceae bacterium]